MAHRASVAGRNVLPCHPERSEGSRHGSAQPPGRFASAQRDMRDVAQERSEASIAILLGLSRGVEALAG